MWQDWKQRTDLNRDPLGDDEAERMFLWTARYGPANSWTGCTGTAARMIRRLLEERERLLSAMASLSTARAKQVDP